MGDVATLLLAIGSMVGTTLGGVAAVIVAIRGSKRDTRKAANTMLSAAVSERDETQDDRIAEIEKKLGGADG